MCIRAAFSLTYLAFIRWVVWSFQRCLWGLIFSSWFALEENSHCMWWVGSDQGSIHLSTRVLVFFSTSKCAQNWIKFISIKSLTQWNLNRCFVFYTSFLKKKKKSQSKDLSLSKKQKQCAKKKFTWFILNLSLWNIFSLSPQGKVYDAWHSSFSLTSPLMRRLLSASW